MKKKLISIFLFYLWCASVFGQYNPSIAGTTSNRPYAPAQATPTDARSYFYDTGNFLWRPYQNTTELKTYLAISKYRAGNVIYVVDSGGVLSPGGVYAGGINTFWMFRNSTSDADLVELNLFGGGGTGGIGTLTNITATNNAGQVWTITSPTSTPNLSLALTLGGDISGAINAVVVNKFNGQPPSYYLNYNNLFNVPTIPAQINPSCVGCTITGTYPNLVWTVTGSGFTTAGVGLIALSSSVVGIDTLTFRKVDSIYSVNDSLFNFVLNGVTHGVSVRGGHGAGGGAGTGTVTTVSIVTANGVSGVVTNPTSTPAITLTLGAITPSTVNGLTLTALTDGFSIAGGTTPRTLTVTGANAQVSNTNTGDVTLAGETYLTRSGQVITANSINVSGTNITGILKAASEPAHTGDVTNSAGSLALTIANNAVSFAKTQQIGASTIVGNNTGGTANELALTPAQVNLMLPVFTPTLNGLVPNPGTATGTKALLDNGTWGTVSGTGSNTSVGAGYRIAINGTSNIKSVTGGLGVTIDSATSNQVNFKVDTSKIQYKGADSIFVQNLPVGGTGFNLFWVSADTIYSGQIKAGANVTITRGTDSAITISATGTGGSGVATVSPFSATSLANGAVISGTTITFGPADNVNPGMVKASGAQTIGATITFSAAPSISTLTANGGVVYLNGSGTFQQSAVGTSTTVYHGGATPFMAALNFATDGTGILPKANGGNGTATPALTAGTGITITGAWPNYTINATSGTVSSVAASGGTTGLTFTGSPITTSGTLTLGGTLGVPNGGSGLSSLSPFAVMTGGSTASTPMQQVSGTGVTGQYLKANAGALPTWGTINLQTVLTNGAVLTAPSNVIGVGSNFLAFTGAPVDFQGGVTLLGMQEQLVLKTANYNVTNNDVIVEGDATSGAIALSLPTNSGVNLGQMFTLKKMDNSANAVTVNIVGGGTIDGSTTYILGTQYQAVTVAATAAGNYHIVSTASVSGAVTSGTYTPTLFNTTNVSASTPSSCQWSRVGNIVTVSGFASVTATSATSTVLGISLPVASNFTTTSDLNGIGSNSGGASTGWTLQGDAANDRAVMGFGAVVTGVPQPEFFMFMYTIK